MYFSGKRHCRNINAVVSVFALLCVFSSAKAQELLIDDFKTGALTNPADYELSGPAASQVMQFQRGAGIIGESRRLQYSIREKRAGTGVIPAGKLSVQTRNGLLVASGDYRTQQHVAIRYQIPDNKRNFSAYDRLQLEFDGIDREVNIVITLCTNNCGNRISHSVWIDDTTHPAISSAESVVVDIPFAEFAGSAGRFAISNVRWVMVRVNAHRPHHSEDFALSQISLQGR